MRGRAFHGGAGVHLAGIRACISCGCAGVHFTGGAGVHLAGVRVCILWGRECVYLAGVRACLSRGCGRASRRGAGVHLTGDGGAGVCQDYINHVTPSELIQFLKINYSTSTILFITRIAALYFRKYREFFNIFLKILSIIGVSLVLL